MIFEMTAIGAQRSALAANGMAMAMQRECSAVARHVCVCVCVCFVSCRVVCCVVYEGFEGSGRAARNRNRNRIRLTLRTVCTNNTYMLSLMYVCMCMYVCMYVCLYVCMYVCMYVVCLIGGGAGARVPVRPPARLAVLLCCAALCRQLSWAELRFTPPTGRPHATLRLRTPLQCCTALHSVLESIRIQVF